MFYFGREAACVSACIYSCCVLYAVACENAYSYCALLCSHSLNESKKQNYALLERLQSMQHEISDSELCRAELEGQIKQANAVSNVHVLASFYAVAAT
jgi:hypothetical protein